MNTWQLLQTIQFSARDLLWEDGIAEPVFHYASVRVSAGISMARFAELVPPLLFLYPGPFVGDPEIHGLGTQTVNARLTVVAADELGEICLVGGNRTGGQGSSSGRGLLEIEAALYRRFEHLNHDVGVHLTGAFAGAAEATLEPGVGYIVTRVGTFEAPVTTVPYFTPPQRLIATAPGGGAVAMSWDNPPERFDFHAGRPWEAARGQMILRRLLGSTPPSGPTQGTAVPLDSPFDEGITDHPGPGTWSYGLFAGYDETGAGGVERTSDQETGTTRTVVVP